MSTLGWILVIYFNFVVVFSLIEDTEEERQIYIPPFQKFISRIFLGLIWPIFIQVVIVNKILHIIRR